MDTLRNNLNQAVKIYFAGKNLQKRGGGYLVTKAIILCTLFLFTYIMIFVYPSLWWWIVMGAVVSSIGFNVLHDASHGSFSKKNGINNFVKTGFDFIAGVSSKNWNAQHVVLHHTFVNGKEDPDIDQNPFFRLSPNQTWKPWHRYQVWYAIILYGLSYFSWIIADLKIYRAKKMGHLEIKFTSSDKRVFFGGKLVFVFMFLVLPLILLPTLYVLLGFIIYGITTGITTSIIFQLAHAVGESAFQKEADFTKRQILESVDFAPENRLANWLTGGLNHQVEHHLWPTISHEHYPYLVKIVREESQKNGLTYKSQSFSRAIYSHFKLLYDLGKEQKRI